VITTAATDPAFVAHAAEFDQVLGPAPRLSLLTELDAHEGPVYIADENALYFTTPPRPGAIARPRSRSSACRSTIPVRCRCSSRRRTAPTGWPQTSTVG
jgi:hypothetical protein